MESRLLVLGFVTCFAVVMGGSPGLSSEAEKYLVPGDMVPIHYDLRWNIHSDTLFEDKAVNMFDGGVRITMVPVKDKVQTIVTNCRRNLEVTKSLLFTNNSQAIDLGRGEFDPVSQKLSYPLKNPLTKSQSVILDLEFIGKHWNYSDGFYRQTYVENGKKKFFEDALPPKSFEEEIFPYVSFSTRCKIINQLARNVKSEQDAEELFKFTNKNYGSKYAELFLAKCSFEFVSEYIINCKPSFNHHDSERNLINICKRFPDLVIKFFQDEMSKDGVPGIKIIKYLAKNHPLAVIPILEKYSRHLYFFRFGKKSTKALHSEFMKLAERTSVSVLMEKINMSVMFKRLSYEEQITFLKLLVQQNRHGSDYASLKDWPRALPKLKHFLELTPPSERARMVETVFYELYNEKYLDHPEMWSLHFVELFPEGYRSHLVEILDKMSGEKAIKNVLRSECRDRERDPKNTFIYLLDFKHAFPMLTEMMSQMTSVGRREILLKEMVRNCVINNDAEGLESVIRYISIRHKNEDPRVICNLILYNLIPSTKILNLNVWNWLEKMATLLLVKLSDTHVFGVVMEAYIAFRLKNDLEAQAQVKSVLKLSVVPHPSSFVLVRKMEKSYSKALIMLYYREIFSGDVDYASEQVKQKLMLSLLMSVNDYNGNKRHGRINMRDLPLLVQGLDRMVRNVRDWKSKHILGASVKRNRFLRNRYARYLIDISIKSKTLRYLMRSHPYCIIDNFGKILTYMIDYNENRDIERIFAYGCQMDFMGYLPEIEKVIGDRFKNISHSSAKIRALKAYSHITSLENFTKLTKQYVPEEEHFKFDTSSFNFYDVQINVPRLIGNVKPIWKNFDFVWKYMKKDFLRWVLPSFFAVCHHTKVSSMLPVLKHHFLEKVDVSVKKVILSCIMDLSSKVERFQYCQMLWEQEKHSSVREFVFHAISRSWRDDRREEVFEMVKKCIREADEITINGRLKMKMIPPQFVNEYASVLWEFTENYEGKTFAVKCRREIVNHFNSENITNLPEEFCRKILSLYLFEPNAEIMVEKFCVDYILHHSQAMDQKLCFVLELLGERRAKLRSITYFINRLKNFARSDPGPVFLVFEGLLREWPKMYGVSKMFEEYLILEYMKGYSTAFKGSDLRKELFASALGREFRKIVNSVPKYECFVEIFKSTMFEFIHDFKMDDVLELVIDSFLGSSFGDVEGIIAIHLIPAKVFDTFKTSTHDRDYKNPHKVELRQRYGGIFQKLLDKNDDVLKIYMNLSMDNALD